MTDEHRCGLSDNTVEASDQLGSADALDSKLRELEDRFYNYIKLADPHHKSSSATSLVYSVE